MGGDLERVLPTQVTTAVREKKKCMMACNVHLWRKDSEEHEGWEGEIIAFCRRRAAASLACEMMSETEGGRHDVSLDWEEKRGCRARARGEYR